ncbi:MAG TPA: DciA family protein [Steroidobacteraceae bacterium]|jgi:hypothetical protein|nr:DciA family protein [Steroidobacteraceae bacterium]
MPKKPTQDKDIGSRNRLASTAKPRRTYSTPTTRPRPIHELITRIPGVARVTRELARQQSWTDWLRAAVSPELAPHIVQVVASERELIVFADSSAWCVRLRYAMASIDEALKQRDPAIAVTRLRVQPPIAPVP